MMDCMIMKTNNMTPKQKAEELLGKYYLQIETLAQQKRCALIAVDEVIDQIYAVDHRHTAWYDEENKTFRYKNCIELDFWIEVKQEIEKL